MTHFLSLVFGNSSPLGLSGGATPSAPPGVAFADLLSAPRAQTSDNLTFSGGLRTGSPPMPGVDEAVAGSQVLRAPGAVVSLSKDVPPRDQSVPTLVPRNLRPKPAAMPGDTATALPKGLGPAVSCGQNVIGEAAIQPVETLDQRDGMRPASGAIAPTKRGAPAPVAMNATAPISASQTLLSGAAPFAVASSAAGRNALTPTDAETLASVLASLRAAVSTQQPEPAPAPASPETDSPETAASRPAASQPVPEPVLRAGRQHGVERGDEIAQPRVAQSPSSEGMEAVETNQPDENALFAEPGDDSVAAAYSVGDRDLPREPIERHAGTTAHADATVPVHSSAVPGPLVSAQRTVATPDEPQPAQSSVAHEKLPQDARDKNPASPDITSHRPAMASAPETGRATEFAQVLQASGGDTAAPPAEARVGAAEPGPQMGADPARNPAEPVRPMAPAPEIVSARPGEIGRQMGVEIARQSLDGRDSLTIRLDPVEMGEIQVRLQFDERGTMRAHVTAERSAALDMLRRDSADLVRALGDAGVRTDAQSFQFEARSHGRGDQQGQQGQHGRPDTPERPDAGYAEAENDDQTPRPKLRSSGSLDLFA